MIRFFLLFLLYQLTLFTVELLQPVQQRVIIPFTGFIADVSAWLIQLFDNSVFAHGVVIRDVENDFAVSIQAGCNGVEAAIVLVAAMAAFPSGWRAKLLGIAIGVLTVQLLNILRIISLFYLGQWNESLFEWAHLYVWQVLIMLDVLIVFLLWLRYLSRGQQPEVSVDAG